MPVWNVTGEDPPTMLIRGTRDTDVPCEQSAMTDGNRPGTACHVKAVGKSRRTGEK